MTNPNLEALIENEKEWRRYMVGAIEDIRKEQSAQKAWSLVFRLSGGAVMAFIYIWFESKLK